MTPKMIHLSAYLPLLLLCNACTAQELAMAPGAISYDEVLKVYHRTGRDESYRCIHQIADERYKAASDSPAVAIVIDDVLYLKLDDRLLELKQTDISEKTAHYTSDDDQIEAGYSIVKQFNFSEYNESDDRNVNLWVKTPDGTQHMKTFGNRCGV